MDVGEVPKSELKVMIRVIGQKPPYEKKAFCEVVFFSFSSFAKISIVKGR